MSSNDRIDTDSGQTRRVPGCWDVLIRAGLILALAMLCYQVFAPFLTLMVWALILAVALYPMHQYLAAKIGRKQGLAATIVVLLGVALIIAPTAVLMSSLGDSVHQLIIDVQADTLEIPAPRDAVATWPVVGEKLYAIWSAAYTDLPALIHSMQPKIGELAKGALAFVAGIGAGLLQFVAAFIIAGIIMAFGRAGSRASLAIFERFAGPARGAEFTKLSTATITAVAQGVFGVAFIQAILVGLCLLLAGIPFAGVLAMIVLVLGIAQVPAVIVTLPAIGYIWWSGRLWDRPGDHLHRVALRLGNGGQCAQAIDARPRRRCADAHHPHRRARRHGGRRDSRDVRRCDAAGVGLPDLHGLGGSPGQRGGPRAEARQTDVIATFGRCDRLGGTRTKRVRRRTRNQTLFAELQGGGVADGTRTHDNRNHNPGLYQLSYSHQRNEVHSAPDVACRIGHRGRSIWHARQDSNLLPPA